MNLNASLPRQPGIRRYFHVQRKCFQRLGLNIIALDYPAFKHFKLWFFIILLFSLYEPVVKYGIENLHDLDEAITSLSPFWLSMIVHFKALYFLRYRRKIVLLIRKIWFLNLKASDKEHNILAAENYKDIMFSTYYYVSVHTTGIFALLLPFLRAGIYAWQGESYWDNLEAPARASYAINQKSILGYITIYISNTFATYFVVYGSLSVDTLYSWFLLNIVSQFRILKHRLRQAGEENNGRCSMKTINDCIALHCRTLELTQEFNNTFCAVIFVKFVISCMQICCLAFLLSRDSVELFDKVLHGLFLLSVSLQLILYCYGGQLIQDESNSIADEIYASFHWHSLSLANSKMLIFSMMRSQKPCYVSGIFFTANLNLFLWVNRTAGSFIALLKTMEE